MQHLKTVLYCRAGRLKGGRVYNDGCGVYCLLSSFFIMEGECSYVKGGRVSCHTRCRFHGGGG